MLTIQVILGYVLLATLVTRFAVLFTAGGSAGTFADDKGQKTDDGRQRAEDGGLKQVKRQKVEASQKSKGRSKSKVKSKKAKFMPEVATSH